MRRDTTYCLVFDGLADWEPALALCEIKKHGGFDVVSVGFSREPVASMGGLTIVPDISLSEIEPERASLFIMPGGEMWEEAPPNQLKDFLLGLRRAIVPIAAICGATLAIARAGFLNDIHHTSNSLDYLKSHVPSYAGEAKYRDELAVRDQNIITASGAGSVEFAHEIITALNLYEEAEAKAWYDLFKHGVMPEV